MKIIPNTSKLFAIILLGTILYSCSNRENNVIPNSTDSLLLGTNCHEANNNPETDLDTALDLHNNRIGLNYYSDHVEYTGNWLNTNTRINATPDVIKSDFYSYSWAVVSNHSQIDWYSSNALLTQ